MNKGDFYILMCFGWGTAFTLGNFWLSVHGYDPLPAGLFTFATALIAGEVLGLSAYKALTYKVKNKRGAEDEPPKHMDASDKK